MESTLIRTWARWVFSLMLGLIWPAASTLAAAEKPPLQHELMGVANGCFVETVVFLDHWRERFGAESWARMLQWGAKAEDEVVAGHAVGISLAHEQLWSWDINYGWTRLAVDPAQREDVAVVAAPVTAKYPRISPQYPLFRFDFPQPSSVVGPAQLAHENQSIRDATIVGERLARHRPVNVVRFSYLVGEERKTSAAVIFIFHGRYCIYVPEYGTVPFRVRGGVENLRLAQEALRRMLPGAGNVEKL